MTARNEISNWMERVEEIPFSEQFGEELSPIIQIGKVIAKGLQVSVHSETIEEILNRIKWEEVKSQWWDLSGLLMHVVEFFDDDEAPLTHPDSLYYDPEMREAFRILDAYACLRIGLTRFEEGNEMAEAIDTFSPGVYVSSVRLIPLNEWRREMKEEILPEYHGFFPWYTELTDLDPLILDELAGGFTDVVPEELVPELQADNVLREWIQNSRKVMRVINTAISRSFSLRAWHVFDKYLTGPVPEKIIKAGLGNVALWALHRHENVSERVFLMGACSPYLDAKDRLELLTEAKLLGILEKGGGEISTLVQEWWANRSDPERFVEAIGSIWTKKMEDAFNELREGNPREKYWEYLQYLRK